MNYNLYSYLIYLPILFFTTIYVGWVLYKNGEHYLKTIFKNNKMVKPVNKVLLIGYYLLNCGYAVIKVAGWQKINTKLQMVNELLYVIGLMYLLLGAVHMFNVIVFKVIGIKLISNHKNQ